MSARLARRRAAYARHASFDPHPMSAALFSAWADKGDDRRRRAVDDFVRAADAVGAWARIEWFSDAGHTAQASLLNWKNPAQAAVVHGEPAFVPDRHFSFDGVDDYLDSLWIPSVNAAVMTGGDLMAFAYERTNVAAAGRVLGCSNTSTRNLLLVPRNTGGAAAGALNTGAFAIAGVPDGRGLVGVQREADNSVQAFRNGASLGSTTPGTNAAALPTTSVFVGGYNAAGVLTSARACSVGNWGWGARMTAAQWRAFNAALQTYRATIGGQA